VKIRQLTSQEVEAILAPHLDKGFPAPILEQFRKWYLKAGKQKSAVNAGIASQVRVQRGRERAAGDKVAHFLNELE